MRRTKLADFIDQERATIVAEWEVFAGTLQPASTGLEAIALRDHADDILTAIVRDMKAGQTSAEQAEKSKGRGGPRRLEEIGKIHAALRIESGFKLGQMVAEYRALRASVLRLWEKKGNDPGGVTRFNESIDEALAEAIGRFTQTTERFRDQSIGILGHDLRNPLSSIVMGATVLISSQDLGDRSISIAARMLNSANRMGRMIADLLDLTRTRFGAPIPVTRVPIDLDPLCRQVIAEFEGLCPPRRAAIHGEGEPLRGMGRRPHRPGALEPPAERRPAWHPGRTDRPRRQGRRRCGHRGGPQPRPRHSSAGAGHPLRADGSACEGRPYERRARRGNVLPRGRSRRRGERSGPSINGTQVAAGVARARPRGAWRGRRAVNQVPVASVEATSRVPPCASTICKAM